MTLAELQASMRAWLTVADDAAASAIAANARDGDVRGGLRVYQNNYRGQLIACLEQSYPRLRTFMGEDAFRLACVRHIDRQPPHQWTLDGYGDDFAATLNLLFPDNPELQELAWLEWTLAWAFVAADATPLAPADLAEVDWERAGLVFIPALATRPARTNASEIWSALEDGGEAPFARMLTPDVANADASGENAGLVVWRRERSSRLRELDAIELAAFDAVRGPGGFTHLCELLADRLGDDAGIMRAGTLLAEWVASGMVSGVVVAQDAAEADAVLSLSSDFTENTLSTN